MATGLLDLTAMEPGAAFRTNFPLTLGVPFAPGSLLDENAVGVFDDAAVRRPVQTRVLQKHADGSIQWLLVDYQADFKPLRPTRSVLKWPLAKEASPSAGPRITTREEGDKLVIENGILRLEFQRDRCQPLVRLWHGGELVSEGGLDFTIISEGGGTFRAGNDAKATFEIEECGPLRCLLRWEGTHRDEKGAGHFDFVVRLTVYAGQPFVRVEHTFFNRLDAPVTRVRQVSAKLPIQLGGSLQYALGGHHRPPSVTAVDQPFRIEQLKLMHHRVLGKDGATLSETNGNAVGCVNVDGGKAGVMLAGKDFWQNYPKAIAAGPEALTYELIPERDKPFEVPMGMAKTHDFFVACHQPGLSMDDLRDLSLSLQRWPMPAITPSEYYVESNAFWDFFPYYGAKYARVEAGLRKMFDADHATDAPRQRPWRAYGLKHYGDFWCRETLGYDSEDPDAPEAYYLNNEYDTPHVLAMLFLRTQEIAKWWGAEAHALHMMDVDTRHHNVPLPPSEALHDWKCLTDCQYRHCFQHVGGIQEPDDTRHKPAEGSHTFITGLVDLYLLTGDRRYIDTAERTALHLAYMINGSGYRWGPHRGSGWCLEALASVYQVRPRAEIKQAADELIAMIVSKQKKDGSIEEGAIHPRSTEDRHIHLCLRGVNAWHRASDDSAVKKLIIEIMEGYLRSGLLEGGLPLASSWPEHSKPTTAMQGFANLESLSYAYDLTGDERFLKHAIPSLCYAVEWITDTPADDIHDNFQRGLRGPFRSMTIAHEKGCLQRVPGAGDWLLAKG